MAAKAPGTAKRFWWAGIWPRACRPGCRCEHACFATLGAIAMNAVRTARIELGEVVAVIGLGLVGQLVAQLVRLQGGVVIGIDLNPRRVDMAQSAGRGSRHRRRFGAGRRPCLTGGRGVDCAIVAAAAKSAAPAQHALALCRDRGRICVVGAVGMEFPWNDMYLKEIQLYMSRAYGPGSYDASYEKQGRDYPLPYVRWTENRNMEEFLRLTAAGRIDVRPLITHEFALDDAAKAYDTIFDAAAGSLAVLLKYPAATAAGPGGGVRAGAPGRGAANARPKEKIEFALDRRRAISPSGSTCRTSRSCPESGCAPYTRRRACAARVTRYASARSTPPANTTRFLKTRRLTRC